MVGELRARGARIEQALSQAVWLPLLLIRLYLGTMFFQTGWGKVRDLDAMAERFAEWAIIWPHFNAALSSYTELIGGALLVVGLFTRLASLPLAFNMIVATLVVKMKEVHGLGDFVTLDEPLYALIFLLFAFTGAGKASLDHLIQHFGKHDSGVTSGPHERALRERAGVWGARSHPSSVRHVP